MNRNGTHSLTGSSTPTRRYTQGSTLDSFKTETWAYEYGMEIK